MRTILGIALLFFGLSATAQTACPLGQDDHLTIQRVMINFGHFTMRPDFVALRGAKLKNETVTTQDLLDSAADLDGAIACAQAVLDSPTGDLVPTIAGPMTDEQRQEFMENFVYMMGEFHDGLVEFQTLFSDLVKIPEADRNFDELYAKSKEVNGIVDRAHRSTSDVPGFAPTLKQNMKTIGTLYKAISASVTNTSKNAANATSALQMRDLLLTVKTQTPDSIAKLPAAQRPAALADFQRMIQQAADGAAKLSEDLKGGRTADAQADLKALSVLKQDGHDKYG